MIQQDLDYNHAKWRLKYSSIINSRKPDVDTFDRNSYNYRYDTMGRESSGECEAYRSAIFYIQLSPKINTKVIEMALKATHGHLYNSISQDYGAYHMLFLNDDKGKLMHCKKPQNNWTNASKICEEYITNYAKTNYKYSKTLSQLFPLIDIYSMDNYPSKIDLCVVICDNDGISLGQTFKDAILQRCNKLIRISSDNDEGISVERVIKIL